MANRIIVFIITALSFGMFSCGSPNIVNTVSSIGAPYEVLVLCSQDKWSAPLGDTIRTVLQSPVEAINQREPVYDVLRVLPTQFSGMLQKNRNVLNIITGNDYPVPSMTARYDVYATPQIIVTVAGPDDATLASYISQHSEELIAIFEIAERDRDLESSRKFGDPKIREAIFEQFGFNMNLSKGYRIRNTAEDFMWISFEYPTASQGVIIYSYPYNGPEDFTTGSLVERRNEFVRLIPGDNPGSHMVTFDGFVPDFQQQRINGRYWAEMRGFWDVAGDFMGGPFVNYSTLDVNTRRVVSLDFYVYSPDKSKRNFMRGLEHLIFSVSFPGDQEALDNGN